MIEKRLFNFGKSSDKNLPRKCSFSFDNSYWVLGLVNMAEVTGYFIVSSISLGFSLTDSHNLDVKLA